VGDVPPLVGVAVKVTAVPEHMEAPGLAPMLTLAVAVGEFTTTCTEAVPVQPPLDTATV